MGQSEGKLSGKVAIVTGAAQGMGAAIAGRLAQEGAKVIVSDINGEKAKQVAEKINAAHHTALAIKMDVTQEHEIAEMVQETLERYGTISILVNNAGILYSTRVDDVTKAEWDAVLILDVNLSPQLSIFVVDGSYESFFKYYVSRITPPFSVKIWCSGTSHTSGNVSSIICAS